MSALAGLVALAACGARTAGKYSVGDRSDAGDTPPGDRTTWPLQHPRADKVDLLFMIDNSASMANKQALLAASVPALVWRLTNPVCVDVTTREYMFSPSTVDEACPWGTEREFDPITDIHLGVITSSLGSLGLVGSSSICSNSDTNQTMDSRAHLVRTGVTEAGSAITVPTYDGLGFLNWDPNQQNHPPGESDVNVLVRNFRYLVQGAGELGCGFEHSLESWYRFLVDPAPYERLEAAPGNYRFPAKDQAGKIIVDPIVLHERRDFLRSDSMVAIIMLTDEDDCSANFESGIGYLPLNAGSMMRASSACQDDPDSPNCTWCWDWLSNPENADPNCAYHPTKNPSMLLDPADDALNMRCFDQKRRFGRDFLFPIQRYVDGLTKEVLGTRTNRFNRDVDILNPLYCSSIVYNTETDEDICTVPSRQKGLVFLAGIVGVPWQDIANNPDNLQQGFMSTLHMNWTAEMFASKGVSAPAWLEGLRTEKGQPATVWNLILGETRADHSVDPNVKPLDPLMIDSIAVRQGVHPITNTALLPPGQFGNPINGAEKDPKRNQDLQYACIFELVPPLDCSGVSAACECNEHPSVKPDYDPLCYDSNTGKYVSDKQFRAKAYPGRRHLATLKGLGSQAIVASICPSNKSMVNNDGFVYQSAFNAIVDRVKGTLRGDGACLEQRLDIRADGTVSCDVLEATKANGACPPCTGVRTDASAAQKDAIAADESYQFSQMNCVCLIKQAEGHEGRQCTNGESVSSPTGGAWCYVDPGQDSSHNPSVMANCPAGNRRTLRFLGNSVPTPGALTYLQCD